jgi:hypothetical protein
MKLHHREDQHRSGIQLDGLRSATNLNDVDRTKHQWQPGVNTETKFQPTKEQFTAFQGMFDFFNASLFSGELPSVLLNLSRKARTLGFFCANRWQRSGNSSERTHEISLNPLYLATRSPSEAASTLVHEMAHLWQQDRGNPSRRGYHNREWAAKMESLGLIPSDTGLPGGRRVGQQMTHYIIATGAFSDVFQTMPGHCLLPWQPVEPKGNGVSKPKVTGPDGIQLLDKSRNKTKYTCPLCGINAWGKPGLNLLCGDCQQPLDEGTGDLLAQIPASRILSLAENLAKDPEVIAGNVR